MFKGAVVEKITPKKAEALLARNTHNRRFSESTVRNYSRLMKEDLWTLNGETIKVASDGTLIDGQHRLRACVDSGATFETYIVYDLNKEIFDTIDIGKKRTAGDTLSVDQVPNSTATAAALRWIHGIKHGGMDPKGMNLSSQEIRDLYKQDEEGIQYAVSRGTYCSRGFVQPGIGGAMFYLMGKKNMSQTENFFELLHSGENLTKGHPVHTLRARLMKSRIGKGQLKPIEVAAMMVHAWNAFRAGEKITVMVGTRMNAQGKEVFPAVK